MATPLTIRGLHHVGRLTNHLEESRAFYRDVLGFREIPRPNFNFPGAWLFNYGLQIHLIVNKEIPPAEAGGPIQTRHDHLAFMVEDLDAILVALKERKIPYRENFVADTNVKQIFFQDPDGHHIEVGIYPPTPA